MASLADSKFNLEWMQESLDFNDPVLHVPSHAKIGPFYFYPATYGKVASLQDFIDKLEQKAASIQSINS